MWFVAIKHLFSRKSQTLLTLLAIVFGACGYVVFSGIQLGFQEHMTEMLIERTGHISILPRNEFITAQSVKGFFFKGSALRWLNAPSGRRSHEKLQSAGRWYKILRSNNEVVAFSPQISRDVIISNGSFTQNIGIVGIDPCKQMKVTNIGNDVTAGDLRELNSGTSMIFIGERLMKILGARVNDTIQVSTSEGIVTPMKIIGTFNTGSRRSDERTAYASISTVQRATNSIGEISTIVVKIKDYNRAAQIATQWNTINNDLVESWDQLNADRLSMMKTQDTVRNVTTIAFIIIVAFGIYNILNMVVTHKMRDIAILRSMGFNQKEIVFLFLVQGVILGVLGGAAGLFFGYLGCRYVETIQITGGPGSVGTRYMRISWDIMIYIKAFVLVAGASAIASYFPARTAGKLSPIEIIRGTI